MKKFVLATVGSLLVASSIAAPVSYDIDPNHTYPSFAADHLGGLSVWRGKFTSTTGKVMLDRQAQAGTIEVTVATASIDFGHAKLNEHARSAEVFDATKFPTTTFQGTFTKFANGAPVEAEGTLTLHGVSRPVTLHINEFLCKPHPMLKKEVCGADASAVLDRSAFGIDYGIKFGFKPDVKLQIQVEALRSD